MDSMSDKIAGLIRHEWGNRLIDLPDGETRWVPPVRDGGATDQLITLSVGIALALIGQAHAAEGDVKRGDTVLVEGVVAEVTPGEPFGTVTVAFPFATDPDGLLDGVAVVAPRVIVYATSEESK
ncbi:hypothetical protein DDP54_15760 (plasmid) [Cellulomonas sp. WB94]|nr:hypothetical protein DDP54_15760 [Cellulomonas sp. WB94]